MSFAALAAGLVLLVANSEHILSVVGFYGVAVGFCAVVMGLARAGKTMLGGWLLAIALWTVIMAAVFFFGGIEVGRAAALMLVVLLAGLCINGRAGVLLALATILATALATYLEINGQLPPSRGGTNSATETVALSTVLIVLGLVVSLATRTTEDAIARFLKGRDELRVALDELQASRGGVETNAQRSATLAELGRALVGHLDDWPRLVALTLSEALDARGAGISVRQAGGGIKSLAAVGGPASTPTGDDLEHAAAQAGEMDAGLMAVALPGGRTRGYVWVISDKKGAAGASDHEFVGTVAAMVSGVLEREHVERRAQESHKLEAVGRLAGSVAHDFNNVLTTVLVSSELALVDMDPDAPARRYVQEVLRAGHHAGALVAQLAAFNRRQPSVAKDVDIGATILGSVSMLERLAGERHRVVLEGAPGEHRAVVDGSQLEQVLLNLVSNARDAMPEGGTIRVRVGSAPLFGGPGVYVEVEDAGEGMSEAVQAHVFEQFFTTKSNGTGLGLATVREIVQGLDGKVELSSKLGEGTRVRLLFPRTDAEAIDAEGPAKAGWERTAKLSVLLVDDHPTVRRAVGAALSELGHEVTEASTGDEALDRYRCGAFDVVLSDVVMPGIDGFALRARIAELGDTPVLLMSGYVMSPDADGQADLLKPFKVAELRAALAPIQAGERRARAGLA